MNQQHKLQPAPMMFPNGGGIEAIKQFRIKRAQAEEAAKQKKKAGK